MPQRFDPSAFVGRTVKQMDEALKGHRGEATAEVTVEGESMPSAELVQLAEIVPAACVLYATTTRTQGTPELQWQLASYADVELLMGEAPTLIGCVHEDPYRALLEPGVCRSRAQSQARCPCARPGAPRQSCSSRPRSTASGEPTCTTQRR